MRHGLYAPLTLASPLTNKKKIEQGGGGGGSSPLEPSEGAFELTHGSACISCTYANELHALEDELKQM